jgi:hypothetical protein
MPECHRCGKELVGLREHMRRVHPQEYWLPADAPPPHSSARQITIEHGMDYGLDQVAMDEWKTERYGWREHGWFIPVEIKDNVSAPAPSQEETNR